MSRLKKLKKIRIHREGTHTLAGSLLLLLVVNSVLYFGLECKLPFYIAAVVSIVLYGMLVNFFRCPIRLFGQEDTEKIVVAPADGKIVVIEEVDENEYFHDRRLIMKKPSLLFKASSRTRLSGEPTSPLPNILLRCRHYFQGKNLMSFLLSFLVEL